MDLNKIGNKTARDSLELLYNIGREFAAALDLRTVLHRVLFLSMRNVGASSGSIIVIDEKGQPVESAFLMIGQTHDQTALQLRVTYDRGLAGWVARNQQPVLIPDTSKDDRWLRRPDDDENRTGSKSAVSAPIKTRDQLVGVMTLVHPETGVFSNQHLELVEAIAGQAGIAILNARLYAESQRRAKVMTAVAESASAINASLQLDVVLQRILEQIGQALQVEGASLALVDRDNAQIEFRASTVESSTGLIGARFPIGQGITGWVAKQAESVFVSDVKKDPRFSREIDLHYGFERSAVLCVPILSEDQVIGVLEVANPADKEFDDDDLLVLSGIGGMAGTAIRHAQLFESLQAAHRRYRELFEASIDPILITDWQGRILEANRQAVSIVGQNTEQLQSMTIDQINQVNWDVVGVGFANLKDSETLSYEGSLRTKGGLEIPVNVYIRIVSRENVHQLQWILRDISERKYLDSLREDLIAMVYHDLRSPLANVVSSLDILRTILSQENDPSIEQLINIATRSTQRIQRLTNSLLDINRLEAGQTIINWQLIAADEIINEAVEAVMPSIEGKEQHLQIDVEEDLPNINVDVDMIKRVLINLLENAVKFTPAEGKIYIGAKRDTNVVQIWVRDTGLGISVADQERIFDKFTRLHAKGERKGIGLGLAFCRLAVEGHGGRIWVKSDSGAGAEFIFALPFGDITMDK